MPSRALKPLWNETSIFGVHPPWLLASQQTVYMKLGRQLPISKPSADMSSVWVPLLRNHVKETGNN